MSTGFVPAFTEAGAGAGEARATALVLHGILASANNWRGFIRRLVRRSEVARQVRWLLVDLRGHGDSTLRVAPPPHTVNACAADLVALSRHLGVTVDLVIGHSFGGKVALDFATRHHPETRAAWFLDTPLGTGDASTAGIGEVERVIEVVSQLSEPLPGRAEVAAHVRASGLSRMLAQWMTTNVRGSVEEGYRWRFDLEIVRALIADYQTRDMWPALEAPRAGLSVHGVRGGRSRRFDSEDVARLDRQGVHVIPDAGHWLHVDQPAALAALLEEAAREVTD